MFLKSSPTLISLFGCFVALVKQALQGLSAGSIMQATLRQKENKLCTDMFLGQLWQQHSPRWHLKEVSLRMLAEACAKRCPCHATRVLTDVWTWNLCEGGLGSEVSAWERQLKKQRRQILEASIVWVMNVMRRLRKVFGEWEGLLCSIGFLAHCCLA